MVVVVAGHADVIRRPFADGALLTVRDLPSGDRLTPDGSLDMRSLYVHMYIPPRLLPVYVLLVGRRQCCGARRTAAHLDYCRRRPCSRGYEEDLRGPVPATR